MRIPQVCLQLLLLACVATGETQASLVATYEGKRFNTGSYLNFFNDGIAAQLIFKEANYVGQTIGASELSAWVISMAPNGPLIISSESPTAYLKLASFTFDSSGRIISWMLDALPNTPCQIGTCQHEQELYTFGYADKFGGDYTRDQAVFRRPNVATSGISNSPGVWTYSVSTVPEPTSVSLALGGALLIALRRKCLR